MIVYNVCKVISRHSVGLDKNIVFEIRIIYFYRAVNQIFVRTFSFGGDILPYHVRLAVFKPFFNFFFRKRKAVLVVFSVAVFVR